MKRITGVLFGLALLAGTTMGASAFANDSSQGRFGGYESRQDGHGSWDGRGKDDRRHGGGQRSYGHSRGGGSCQGRHGTRTSYGRGGRYDRHGHRSNWNRGGKDRDNRNERGDWKSDPRCDNRRYGS